MSHSVTIRTQTMTTSSSMIVINTGYLKSWNGILKFLQLALGIVCVGIIGNEFNTYLRFAPQCFFLVITVTFMISTFILLLSCLMSLSTASIISKTIYVSTYVCVCVCVGVCVCVCVCVCMCVCITVSPKTHPSEITYLIINFKE
ncbi:hypothetical protein EAG_05828 [Camponotus floridanus]|uniref:MARVEL domain-containing protein n=1 Tax=Camponotus floridanus TaxID=104421 RepID=E2AZP3_CAMFO|nr:hypothetical protein EAG_05828 [Camponotus floridanus]